ncbi:TPA: hypothetical protein QH074_004320 [Enterobacter hormaechei subsp. steigerwaltii]|nr:hypothetical protein [Enterobacter hormaechei subsp. steigerwaltii]
MSDNRDDHGESRPFFIGSIPFNVAVLLLSVVNAWCWSASFFQTWEYFQRTVIALWGGASLWLAVMALGYFLNKYLSRKVWK